MGGYTVHMTQTWHFDPNEEDEFDSDRDDVGPDTGPEYDRPLNFHPSFRWSILDDSEGNDEEGLYE